PGDAPKNPKAASRRLRIAPAGLGDDWTRDKDIESVTAGPPLPGDLLMCGLNDVLGRSGHEVAHDRGLDIDLGLHHSQFSSQSVISSAQRSASDTMQVCRARIMAATLLNVSHQKGARLWRP